MIAKNKHNCKPHTYQDKAYGKGMRVMNPMAQSGRVRCTVCGKEENVGSGIY